MLVETVREVLGALLGGVSKRGAEDLLGACSRHGRLRPSGILGSNRAKAACIVEGLEAVVVVVVVQWPSTEREPLACLAGRGELKRAQHRRDASFVCCCDCQLGSLLFPSLQDTSHNRHVSIRRKCQQWSRSVRRLDK